MSEPERCAMCNEVLHSADGEWVDNLSQPYCPFSAQLHVPLAVERLEYLRGELRAERISQGELIELQNLVPFIEDGDVELLEAAGVPEFEDTYKIVRFFRDEGRDREIIETGLTLEEAQAHCRRADTRGEDWFDGYESE